MSRVDSPIAAEQKCNVLQSRTLQRSEPLHAFFATLLAVGCITCSSNSEPMPSTSEAVTPTGTGSTSQCVAPQCVGPATGTAAGSAAPMATSTQSAPEGSLTPSQPVPSANTAMSSADAAASSATAS